MIDRATQLDHVAKLCDAGNSEAIQAWSLQCAKTEISHSTQAFVYIERYLGQHLIALENSFNCLDALRPMHYFLIDKLFTLMRIAEPSNSPHNHVVSNSILTLIKAENAAYQHLLKRSLTEASSDEFKATILHRAIATQLNALLNRHKLKLPIPSLYWRNFHTCFALANKQNMLSFRNCDGSIAWDQRLSIENIYAMALLLDSARLNQLNNSKISSCFEILSESINLVTLSATASAGHNEIVVDMSSDSGPHFSNLFDFCEKSVIIYLNISELLRKLRVYSNSKSSFIAPLYLHLINAWSHCNAREKREAIEQDVYVSIDFNDIHCFLSGGKKLQNFIGDKANLAIAYEDGEDIAELESQRAQNVYYSGLIEARGELVSDEIPEWTHLEQHFSYPLKTDHNNDDLPKFKATLKDKSEHGCRLSWHGSDIPVFEIGMLMAIEIDKTMNHWIIAEVAWLHNKDAQHIETGIKILSLHPTPVAVDVPLKACLQANYLPALLLPPDGKFQPNCHFLVGRHGYEKGDQTKITQGHGEINLKLTQLTQQYNHYNLFECAFFSEDERQPH